MTTPGDNANFEEERLLGSCLLWFIWGVTASFLAIFSLMLVGLIVASISLNAYLAWELSGYEVLVSRSTSDPAIAAVVVEPDASPEAGMDTLPEPEPAEVAMLLPAEVPLITPGPIPAKLPVAMGTSSPAPAADPLTNEHALMPLEATRDTRLHDDISLKLRDPEPNGGVELNLQNEEIVFAGGWDSLAVLNAIAMYIVEHGYGYPVKEINLSVESMMNYLPLGDVDVSMELWRFSKQEWYGNNLSAGRIIDVGAIFESSTQGLYVPRYMIEGDPARGIEPTASDLKSVTDLPKYWELFADSANPAKGTLVGCLIKWKCYKIVQVKTAVYGLDEHFKLLTPRTKAGRNMTIAEAYTRGEPVLLYHWEPSALLGKYDMIRLEEPEYTDECWAELEMAINQDPLGSTTQACAYPVNDIHTTVHGGLLDRAPEVVTLLKNMFVGTARTSELTAYMAYNKVEPQDAAIYYLQTYEHEWRHWVPADVAKRVKVSLP
jgi:glycine betaine/proline transport system substrate-binding protein